MPAWKVEIEELHAFFEGWIGGKAEWAGDGPGRLEAALADGFTFVTTSGELLDREAVVTSVRDARGARPGLRISIREPRLVQSADDHLVVVYEEWQEAAGERNGRISTVVFRASEAAPNGLVWTHVHETPIGAG